MLSEYGTTAPFLPLDSIPVLPYPSLHIPLLIRPFDVSMELTGCPLALIAVPIRVLNNTPALSQVIGVPARVLLATLPFELAFSMPVALSKVACVGIAARVVLVTQAVRKIVLPGTFVVFAVRPVATTLALLLVLDPVALVALPVWPG